MPKPWMCLDCRVMMRVVNEDFCKCPECGTEVWFKFGEPTALRRQKEYISRSLPEGVKVPGGSSKSGKRSKERMKKPTLAQINSGLAGKAASFESC